jgi:hypothetical protein
MSRFRAFLPAALVLLAACGPTVTVDVSPEVAVPGGGTYAWGGQQIKLPSEVQQGIVARSPAIQAWVKKAIDAELQKKGYRLVDSTQAAFFVRYAVGSRVGRERDGNLRRLARRHGMRRMGLLERLGRRLV